MVLYSLLRSCGQNCTAIKPASPSLFSKLCEIVLYCALRPVGRTRKRKCAERCKNCSPHLWSDHLLQFSSLVSSIAACWSVHGELIPKLKAYKWMMRTCCLSVGLCCNGETPERCLRARPTESTCDDNIKVKKFFFNENRGRCRKFLYCPQDEERFDNTTTENYFLTREECECVCPDGKMGILDPPHRLVLHANNIVLVVEGCGRCLCYEFL